MNSLRTAPNTATLFSCIQTQVFDPEHLIIVFTGKIGLLMCDFSYGRLCTSLVLFVRCLVAAFHGWFVGALVYAMPCAVRGKVQRLLERAGS